MDKKQARDTAIAILGAPLGRQVVDIRVTAPSADDQEPFKDSGLKVGDKFTFTFGNTETIPRLFRVEWA